MLLNKILRAMIYAACLALIGLLCFFGGYVGFHLLFPAPNCDASCDVYDPDAAIDPFDDGNEFVKKKKKRRKSERAPAPKAKPLSKQELNSVKEKIPTYPQHLYLHPALCRKITGAILRIKCESYRMAKEHAPCLCAFNEDSTNKLLLLVMHDHPLCAKLSPSM